jgi:acyl-coenzyme A synthetase/AMP-(fatty) acid ligase
LEALLLEHPDIDDAAVVGQWVEERATEVPVAFVVLRKGALSERDSAAVTSAIYSWLNPRIANHKRLRGGIRYVEAIPKSASGKILRRELRVMLKNSEKLKARL